MSAFLLVYPWSVFHLGIYMDSHLVDIKCLALYGITLGRYKVLGSNEGIKLEISFGKVLVTILVHVDWITLDPLVVIARHLGSVHISVWVVYHAIVTRVIRRVAMTAVTAAAWAGLIWSGVHVLVVGCIFGGVGCHTTSKGVELSCELYYVISFWSWIFSWKYPYWMEISTFRGFIRILWKYPCSVDIIRISCIYPYFVDIIPILCIYPCSVDIIHI